MVSLTKKRRYSKNVVKALMENYHELEATITEGNPSHMEPMWDYNKAVKSVALTDMERKVLAERFPMVSVCPTTAEVATSLGISKQYVGKIAESLTVKIENEMNRGVYD